MITQEKIAYSADEIKAMVKTCEKYNKVRDMAKNIYYNSEFEPDEAAVLSKYLPMLFPEFKESKDERIRKALIKQFSDYDAEETFYCVKNKDILAWLEKQGEQSVEPKWCHHKVDLSDCSEEYRKAYYDGWNNCNMQHSQCEVEKKELKKIPNAFEECEIVHVEHGKYYYCIKDYYAGGNKRASKGDVVQASNGMSMMALGVKANEYFIPVNNIKQMYAWSEEDEEMLKWLCRIIHTQRLDRAITLKEESELGEWMDKWLNHNPQPKQCEHLENYDEEERIRKGLIKAVSRIFEGYKLFDTDVTREDCLAWLEKQGKEEYALKSFRDKDVHKFMQYIEKQAKAYEFNLPNRSYDIYAFAKDILHWLEKQGEKKLNSQMEKCINCQFVYTGYCDGTCILKNNEQKPVDKVMKKELRFCIEYVCPTHPLNDDGSVNVRHFRTLSEEEAENALVLLLECGCKLIDLYRGNVQDGKLAEWSPLPMIVNQNEDFYVDGDFDSYPNKED